MIATFEMNLQDLLDMGGLRKGEHLIEGHNSRLDTLQAIVLPKKIDVFECLNPN